MERLRVGIVGAGRMGRIRAVSAHSHPQCKVVKIADTRRHQAETLATELGCSAGTDWSELIQREDIDAVVVATPHKYLAPISTAALKAGKHVFCEKPGARSAAEIEMALSALAFSQIPSQLRVQETNHPRRAPCLVVGFTLRHHPAVARAHELVAQGAVGQPMYVLARYGHGGRPGYEQEWRGDRELAGGGELLDQGVHLIDLCRWFMGEFEEVSGFVSSYFWHPRTIDTAPPLEDNAFLLLRNEADRVAWLHASWTQWKNVFSFEIYGEDGFLQVNGLGGHYGRQQLLKGRRRRKGGPPEVERLDFRVRERPGAPDSVWTREWSAFVSAILEPVIETNENQLVPPATAYDAWQALRIVEAAYEAARRRAAVPLNRPIATSFRTVTRQNPKAATPMFRQQTL